MKKLLALTLASLFACATAFAADDKMAPKTNTQQTKMTTCQKEAGDKKLEGKARQDYVNDCLKAKPAVAEKPKNKMAICNEKTKGMTKAEADKTRSECLKAA
jgi:psiF repeat